MSAGARIRANQQFDFLRISRSNSLKKLCSQRSKSMVA
jgi:hypothetical protein